MRRDWGVKVGFGKKNDLQVSALQISIRLWGGGGGREMGGGGGQQLYEKFPSVLPSQKTLPCLFTSNAAISSFPSVSIANLNNISSYAT